MSRHSYSQRGYSLIEAMVVVTLVGIAAAITLAMVRATYQRYQLRSTVTEIQGFLQATAVEAGATQASAFLRLVSNVRPRRLQICREVACTHVLRQMTIPDWVSFSISDVNDTTSNWPTDTATSATPPVRVLGCDTMGRTLDPGTSSTVTSVQTLIVTHNYMVEGSLRPRLRNTIQVFPLWKTSVHTDTW